MNQGDSAVGKVKENGPSNLTVRIGTALVLGPLVLALLFFGPAWAWALLIILTAAQVGNEFLLMTHPEDRVARGLGALMAGTMAAASYAKSDDPRWFFTAVVVCLGLGAVIPLVRLGEVKTAATRLLGGTTAPLYVGVLVSCLALLRRDAGDLGPRYVLLTLFIAWMADTGGYAAGRLFGKTKLYEAVSPKKTREGLLGGVVVATTVAVISSLTFLPDLSPIHAAALGCAGALLGQVGDLVESLLKRSTGVKDSGSILPGHGGLFDRVDGLLVVAPLVYLHYLWTH